VPLRVIVIDLSVGEAPGRLIKLVNPEIVEKRASSARRKAASPSRTWRGRRCARRG
jgi:hypothetical protein